MSGPSKIAATRRIRQKKDKTVEPVPPKPRRSPRKRKIMNYKDFVSGLDENDQPGLTSPKKRKSKVGLKQPSRTRIAAQKKIQTARTQRLCSPPPPTRVTTATTPDHVPSNVGVPYPTVPITATITETEPNPDQDLEMNEAANTLLSLSGDIDRSVTEAAKPPSPPSPTTQAETIEDKGHPPVALEVNVIITHSDESGTINSDQIIGSAVKEESYGPKQEPTDKQSETASKTSGKSVTIKHFSMKSYRLKRKPEIKRRFKCRICPEILDSVHKYNYHYREKHPPLPCPYCTRSFNAPRYLSRHLYTHAETMYECEKCDKGFAFKSQYTAHKRRHIKDNDYVCMKVNCGKRFKHDSELKAHVKNHRKTNIKCGHQGCTYSNKDIRNIRAHRKCHTDEKPYKCANCGAAFKWQQQKKRHLVNCK